MAHLDREATEAAHCTRHEFERFAIVYHDANLPIGFSEVGKSNAMAGLGNRLCRRFRGSEGPNEYWLMWLWFDGRTAHDPAPYSRWQDNVQPWIDMVDGTMADNFASLATDLHEAALELSRS